MKRYLVAGLLVWLPLVVTIFAIRFLVNLMDRTLLLLPTAYQPETLFGFHIPGLGVLPGSGQIVGEFGRVATLLLGWLL